MKQLALDIMQPKEIGEPKETLINRKAGNPQHGFHEFWRAYPRKCSKGQAIKAYTGIMKSKKATASELIAGAMRYGQERVGQDPKYTKHAATWLNAECWLDEPQLQTRSAKLNQADTAIAGMARFLNRERPL